MGLRNRTFYIIYQDHASGYHTDDIYWTKHEHLVRNMLIQNAHIEYDILEIRGDNIIEVSDICLNEYNLTVDIDNELKYFYTNDGIEFLSSIAYVSNTDVFPAMDTIERILVSSYINICKFMPYVSNQYKPQLEIFLKLLSLYISRIVLFNNVSIEDLPISVQRGLKFIRDGVECYCISADEVLDDTLLFYISEYGW